MKAESWPWRSTVRSVRGCCYDIPHSEGMVTVDELLVIRFVLPASLLDMLSYGYMLVTGDVQYNISEGHGAWKNILPVQPSIGLADEPVELGIVIRFVLYWPLSLRQWQRGLNYER